MKIKTLITAEEIERRTQELAEQINAAFKGPLLVLSILKGSFIFVSDLIRKLEMEVEVDFIRLKSYEGTRKTKDIVSYIPEIPLKGRDVLLVDDILDTGGSLKFARKLLSQRSPKSLKTCVLLRKNHKLKADFIGFDIPNVFVVGYGLDYRERFRNLPYVAYLEGEA